MTIIGYLKTLLPFQLILFYVFITSGLIVNFLQVLTLPLWYLGNIKLYRKLNIWLANLFWSNLTALASYWSGSDMKIFMDPKEFKYLSAEHAMVVMNHKYDIDWLMGWIVCQRGGMLSGHKIIGKATLGLIPLMGWAWMFTESIFIKRQWETDKKKLTEGLDKILCDYPDDYFFNILIFPEGTRFTKNKHEISMQVAREKGLQELKHHLLPRTKGFTMLNKGAQGRISAIYDLTIGIADNAGQSPNMNAVRNGVPFKGELFVRRIPIADVPQDDEGSAQFIQDLFRKKDEIFDVYDKTGSFESLGKPCIDNYIPVNYHDLYIGLMWTVLLVTPLVYYLIDFAKTATLFSNIMMMLVFVCLSLAANVFVRLSSSEKGSSYGKASPEKKKN